MPLSPMSAFVAIAVREPAKHTERKKAYAHTFSMRVCLGKYICQTAPLLLRVCLACICPLDGRISAAVRNLHGGGRCFGRKICCADRIPCVVNGLFSFSAEIVCQDAATFFSTHAPGCFKAVIERKRTDIQYRPAGAGPWVSGAENHPFDPRIDCGPGAHGTGFQRDIQRATGQSPAAELAAGFLNSENFGMMGGTAGGFPGVPRCGEYASVAYDDRADRYLVLFCRFLRQGEGKQGEQIAEAAEAEAAEESAAE